MLKKWSVALLVAAGAAGLVGCNTNQGGKKDAEAAALTEAEVPTDTENFDTGLTARSLSLVQNDVAQSMGDVISPISGALHVLDSHYATVSQNFTNHQNGGSADLHANEADRLNLVYNAIRDRFDGIYDNTGAAEVKTDVATVTIENVVKGSTYTVTVASNTDISLSNAATSSGVSVSAVGMDDVEAVVVVTPDDKKLYTLSFEAVASGDATIDLHNVAGGYTVNVTDGTATAEVTGGLKDDFAPLVALQHADRNGQDKTNYNNTSAPHDSIGMLIEFGEESTDEAGEPLNGQMQEFYPKLNLTASLYDECHKRAKTENLDVNVSAGQEPINASELDVNYYTTPLLATERSATINGVTYGTGANGKCATEQNVGSTCATNRSDRFYNENDYTCWEGVSSANSCKYYVPEPGAATGFVEVTPAASNQSGYSIVTTGAGAGTEIVPNTAASSLLTLATVQAALGYAIPSTDSDAGKSTMTGTGISFQSPVDATITYPSSIVFKGPANCEGTTTELARSVVVDLTDDVAPIAESAAGSAKLAWASAHSGAGKNIVNHDGTNTTGNSLLASDGLWHLETPQQYYDAAVAGRNYQVVVNYDEDNDNNYTDDWTLSTRTHHLVATFGDWRTIDENRRFISSSQDVVRGDTSTLYGPRMGYVVNSNVYGPVSDGAAVTNYHFGLRAEDYVVDSESDGAVRDTLVKLTGETDATNTALVVGSGDATGVVFVDATPAMNKETNSLGTGGGSIMINNDGSITLSFDQNVLDVDNYPDYAYLDLFGDDFVYRVDLGTNAAATDNDATVVRGLPYGGDSGYLNGVSGTLDVSTSSTLDGNNNANSKRLVGASTIDIKDLATNGNLYEGSKIRLTEVDPGSVTSDTSAGSNTISLSGLETGIIAEGSIIQIGNGERAHRYRIVDNTDGDGYVTVGSTGIAEFVVTPALRSSLAAGRDVTVEKSSTHVLTAEATIAAGAVNEAAIHPSLPSNYGARTSVTVLNGIYGVGGNDTAYTDVFGMSTGEFDGGTNFAVAATVAVSGSTMTITVSDTTPDAASGGFSYPLTAVDAGSASETVDMGAFFSDLSHVSADSKNAAVGTTPSFFINYEDVQDTNFNSWAKTDEYDNYDDGRSPLVVAKDGIGPKLLYGAPITANDTGAVGNARASQNTFLYDVTSWATANGITLAAAHGNHNLLTDDDIIYTPGISGTTYVAPEVAYAAAAGVEADYPLFWFWGHQTKNAAGTTTAATKAADGGNVDTVRAVLRLNGVTTIDTSQSQAYIYAPDEADTDQGDAIARGAFTSTCNLAEGEIDDYIIPSAVVGGIRQSESVGTTPEFYGSSNPDTTNVAAAASNNSVHYQLDEEGDVLNVDADVNVNIQTNQSTSALIVGIPAYDTDTWNSPDDTLVVEDVVLDGVNYTLHFKIPTFVETDNNFGTAGHSALKTAETDNLPEMRVYRKVSLSGVNLMPSRTTDVCSPRNLRTGNLVEDAFDPDGVVFTFREDLSAAPTVTWRDGDDNDESAAAGELELYSGLFSGTPNSNLVTSNPNQARIRFHDITEATTGYIGHDAQFDVTGIDYAGNPTAFTVTLRLGHGATASAGAHTVSDDRHPGHVTINGAATLQGAVSGAAAGTGVVFDPILNVIGTLGDIHNESDTDDTAAGSGTAVE